MDASLGVRVDNLKEEGSVGSQGPTSIEEWRELGKMHVQSGEVTEAAQCYAESCPAAPDCDDTVREVGGVE